MFGISESIDSDETQCEVISGFKSRRFGVWDRVCLPMSSIREIALVGMRDARNEDMIEPYYAAWLNVRNEQMKK